MLYDILSELRETKEMLNAILFLGSMGLLYWIVKGITMIIIHLLK